MALGSRGENELRDVVIRLARETQQSYLISYEPAEGLNHGRWTVYDGMLTTGDDPR